MAREFGSIPQYYDFVKSGAEGGAVGDYIEDSARALENLGVQWDSVFLQDLDPNIQKLLSVTHYVRTFNQRHMNPVYIKLCLGSTLETLTTSAIVTQAMYASDGKKIGWFSKVDFETDSGGKDAQKALIKYYNQIEVRENQGSSSFRKATRLLNSGSNLGIFPEVTPGNKQVRFGFESYHLQNPFAEFGRLVNNLAAIGPEFQVIPTAIFYERGFQVVFGIPIDPHAPNVAELTFDAMNEQLPEYLRRR